MKSYEFNVGQAIKNKDFEKYFVRVSKDQNDKINVFAYEIVDGVEKQVEYFIHFVHGEHKIDLTDFNKILDLSTLKIDIFKRAEKFNKVVLGYSGKDSKRDKFWDVLCKSCGFLSSQRSRIFGKCKGCKIQNMTRPFEEFAAACLKKHNGKYIYDDPEGYVNSTEKIKIFCTKCEKYFWQLGSAHLSGSGCPLCRESKGELKISQYLKSHKIAFEPQQYFHDCRHINLLKFDFYLTEKNGLVEFDGEHHYKPTFGSTPEERQNNFENQQIRDRIKDEWAKANNIPLLRIPYWDFDRIPEILDAFIVSLSAEQKLLLEM